MQDKSNVVVIAIAGAVVLVLGVVAFVVLRNPRGGDDSASSKGVPQVDNRVDPGSPPPASAVSPGAAEVESKPMVKEPVLISKSKPQVPEMARRLKLHGRVTLRAVITKDGDVEVAKVTKSAHPLLDGAAERAVSQWKYRPGTVNGRPVRAELVVFVDFEKPE